MKHDGFHKLVAHGVDGAEGGHGLLEDEANLATPDRAHFVSVGIELRQVDDLSGAGGAVGALPPEQDFSPHNASGPIEDLEYGTSGDALAAAAFTDEAQCLSLVQVETGSVNGDDGALVQGEVSHKVSNRKERALSVIHLVPPTGRKGLRRPAVHHQGS